MKRTILIRGARQLLTLHGPASPRRGDALSNLAVIEDGSILIVNGSVATVGPTRRIENLAEARSAEEINAHGRVVMPGFVDSHTRLISAPARLMQPRSFGQRRGPPLAQTPEFLATLQYVRNATAKNLEFHARKYLEGSLRHGTTTLEAKSGYGLNTSSELKTLRVLSSFHEGCVGVVPTFLGAHAVPPEFSDPCGYINWVCSDLMPKLRERKLTRFVDLLCDSGGFTAEQGRPYLNAARRLGLAVKVHGDQSARTGAAALAVEFDATSADGLNAVSRADIAALAESNTIATLLPATTWQGAHADFAPARELIDGGASVALASAFDPSTSSTFNMQMVVALACNYLKMTPEEAIAAATINGAHAVGQANRCGSLEFGKDADLLILNVSDYREIPLYFGCGIVAVAMRKGEVVYREGALTCGGA